MIRVGRTTAALLVVVMATAAAAPASASTAAGRVGLSLDGHTWSTALTAPLFDPAFRWVPGDSQTRSFYVRNQSHGPSTLDVAVRSGGTNSLLQTGDLAISARAGSGPWTSIADPGRHVLVHSTPVGAGQRERISVKASIASASVNQAQRRAVDLRFGVRLTQARGTSGSASDRSTGTTPLPGAGGPYFTYLAAGLVLLSCGLLARAAARRREDGVSV